MRICIELANLPAKFACTEMWCAEGTLTQRVQMLFCS